MKANKILRENKYKTILILVIFIFLLSGFFYIVGKTINDTGLYLFIGLIISLTSGLISYYYSDKIVLSLSRAQLASEEIFPDYYEITRNLVLLSDLPMPKLYVIADESMNAFATGRNAKHSSVAVTTGLLQKLDYNELQGVIAHELGHIKNYDILLMSVVSIIMGVVVMISDSLQRNLIFGSFSKNDNKKSPKNVIYSIFFIVSLLLMPIIATLIQLAISRKREFMADTYSAEITRNPKWLINALTKISKDPNILKTSSNATAHMYIVNPLTKGNIIKKINSLFSTHPPVEERIRMLEALS